MNGTTAIFSGGADIGRLLAGAFAATPSGAVTVDGSVGGHAGQPRVTGVAVGSAAVYVRSVDFAKVSVSVSDSVVGLKQLWAGVVTGVSWAAAPPVGGPFVPIASQVLDDWEIDARGGETIGVERFKDVLFDVADAYAAKDSNRGLSSPCSKTSACLRGARYAASADAEEYATILTVLHQTVCADWGDRWRGDDEIERGAARFERARACR